MSQETTTKVNLVLLLILVALGIWSVATQPRQTAGVVGGVVACKMAWVRTSEGGQLVLKCPESSIEVHGDTTGIW